MAFQCAIPLELTFCPGAFCGHNLHPGGTIVQSILLSGAGVIELSLPLVHLLPQAVCFMQEARRKVGFRMACSAGSGRHVAGRQKGELVVRCSAIGDALHRSHRPTL